MSKSRQSLKAYLKLQQSHRELHKVLKALEEDATDDEVMRRIAGVQTSLQEVQVLLGMTRPPALTVLEKVL